MAKLFAGIGADGALRFIGDVPRGAACECWCPECGSPLVARQGSLKDWHFAHEAGQERPECETGAVNLLRRLAIEQLQGRSGIRLPAYTRKVSASSKWREWWDEARWEAQFVAPLTWFVGAAHDAPVARGLLDTAVEAELYVHIGDGVPAFAADETPAAVAFSCSMPSLADLRDREFADRHIATTGCFVWLRHPDVVHLVEVVRQRLEAQVAAADAEDEKERAARAVVAGRRWAGIARGLRASTEPHQSPLQHQPRAPVDPAQQYDWAPMRKTCASFFFYRLKDGSAWVVYEMDNGSNAIAPWPKDDGWDEALPPSVGVPDPALGIYRETKSAAAASFFLDRRVMFYVSSDPRDFEGR